MKLVIFVLAVCLRPAFSKHLPPGLTKCDLSDPNHNICLTTAIQEAVLALKDGNKAYGVPPLVPLEISNMVIGEGAGAVKVVQNYKDIKIYGITNIKVPKASYDAKTNVLEVTAKFPEMTLKAHYTMDGQILVLPIKGTGPCIITLYEPTFTHKFFLKDVVNNGKTYVQVDKHELTIQPKKMHFDFQNLFEGNTQLSDVLLKTINENWEEVYNDVRNGYEKSFSEIYLQIANRFLSKVPKEEIFS